MSNFVKINHKITGFNKKLTIDGDKSLSIRWALLSSQSIKKSKASNLLLSEDVISTLNCLKKLGIKIKISKNICEITGLGLNGFRYKDNLYTKRPFFFFFRIKKAYRKFMLIWEKMGKGE